MKKIVVVGGGAGGMELVKKIGSKLGKQHKAEITLVDICNHHIWKPLLHELATGSLDEGTNAIDYQVHGAHNGYLYQQGALSGIDRDNRQVILAPLHNNNGEMVLDERRLDYDYLVLGIGAVSNDFGIRGVKEHAYTLDLTEQAMTLRERIQHLFMQHANGQRQGKLKVAIVGAGATGVEMSAELHHMAHALRGYGYHIDDDLLQLTLIEASESVMPALPKSKLRQLVNDKLLELGVDVRTETMVTSIEATGLHTKCAEFIEADLIIWAAGVKAPEVLSTLGLETNNSNQVVTDDTGLSVSDERIFSFGDCACVPQENGVFLPPRGQTARQLALVVGDNLMRRLNNPDAELKHYVYKDLGSFVNLARFNTVGNLFSHWRGGLQLAGAPARFVYASLYRRHLLTMHGPFKGSLLLLINGLHSLLRPQLKLW
ncbi:NAD(P)/FAD-dependent oxidoreductase [Ferrimonas lipolytica]|uniref:NAD(P)/FAD-dependent oxidoreductase n=1 Tax=Ferrimonas lipolytica TaxID=2724191 RepID=A0A6H1UIH7_9GAMM|nr:NAD(P)/FAD-dependent oxidoreductase [Ferrimonas lipolytica]QIZ78628.1 NAD(P)/FAD-dependent oxidoreductase [Ferrimonas lipolytica]